MKHNQPSAWIDMHRSDDGSLTWGIEINDPELTFDGHFVALFPKKEGEHSAEGAYRRASFVLRCMMGYQQAKRTT